VADWQQLLSAGSTVKDDFEAGSARVRAKLIPEPPGDVAAGCASIEARLIQAVKACQRPGATEIHVTVAAAAGYGFRAACLVSG
jgi:hypothetical protein